jgi:hypothetical protein
MIGTTIDEEWNHHQFATRDLEVLERSSDESKDPPRS